MRVLVTGGAGFIGTYLVRRLLQSGADVTILDNFSPQIHGGSCTLPADIGPHVRLIVADVQDPTAMAGAVAGQNAVVHLAAETGTGQSMYEVVRYEQVNMGGTANLLQALSSDRSKSVTKLVVASSRAIYGEGRYLSPVTGPFYPGGRSVRDMKAGRFEPMDPATGQECSALATPEDAPMSPTSFYGLTKQVQEQMCLLWGKTLGISTFALRYQNVYGPGQSLRNPYTGILAIFSNQARTNQPIRVFEDGKESRDFVHVEDVVDATTTAVMHQGLESTAINVGSGIRTTVLEVVQSIVRFFDSQSTVAVTGAFRQGDIRHCYADLERATEVLKFAPKWSFTDGVRSFLEWAREQQVETSGYASSLQEMKERGLYHE
jgi:dTDP-L-rhamnose 4-epimerase